MPDIFLSYSRDDLEIARRFAEGFEREGFSVWWDAALNPGDAFDQAIEKALDEAKAVVVLWSKSSVASRWVRAEATQANDNRTLVPAMIEPCKRPIIFELTHTVDLSHWNGDPNDKAWQTYVAGVRRFVDTNASGPTAAPVASGRRIGRTINAKSMGILTAVLVVVGAVLWVLTRSGSEHSSTQAGPGIQEGVAPAAARPVTAPPGASLAVLPFVNMSSDHEQDYFSDGLSEELLNQLAQVPHLRVIGRTSSFAFKGQNENPRRIGELLGVNHILEGSVRKFGKRVNITAQLINPIDGSLAWSASYERTLDDIFAIQDEIARKVAAELQLRLGTVNLDTNGTRNVAAFDEFLAGRALLNSNEGDSMRASVPHLERAVELDATYVPARLWLIDAYTRLTGGDPQQAALGLRKERQAIDQIVKLVPGSAEASLALSYRAAQEDDLQKMDRLLKESLQLTGGSGMRARLRYGQFLLGVGQSARAISELERVRQDDPLDIFARTNLLMAYEVGGESARADTEMRQLLLLPGGVSPALLGTAVTRAQGQRDIPGLREALAAALASEKSRTSVNAQMQPLLNDPILARRKLRQLATDARFEDAIYGVSGIAQWAAYLGDTNLSLQELNALRELHFSFEIWGFILWRPVMRDLHREPGFKELLRKVGLVEYWRGTGNWGDFCKPVGKDDFECQ